MIEEPYKPHGRVCSVPPSRAREPRPQTAKCEPAERAFLVLFCLPALMLFCSNAVQLTCRSVLQGEPSERGILVLLCLPALMLFRLCRALTFLCLLPFLFLVQSAPAQIQQAWVARYNNGITNGTNQAVKMASDSTGNIYITGFSQNTNTNLGYVTIKYAPNGNQLWVARYDSTNYPTATPSGFALDSGNNVVVTGNALTIKYDTNGSQLWTAPYDGAGLAIDSSGDSIVTGFASGFNSVKLSPNGSNVWSASYVSQYGPALSQAVVVDSAGNAYVAGSDTYICYYDGPYKECYAGLLIAKYDQSGNQQWINIPQSGQSLQVCAAAIYNTSNLYLVANDTGPESAFQTFSFSTNGSLEWTAHPDNGLGPANGLALDNNANVILAGQNPYAFNAHANYIYNYTSFKISPNGTTIWTNNYPQPPTGSSAASSVAVDAAGGAYVTGYSAGTNGTNDIVTIKYDPNGNQVWLQRYSSPSGGNAAGNAIAVDNNGNVYVTGYDTTAQGGTEIVTIKYSPVTLQRRSDGTVILQAQGSPGEAFDIEASADLLNWLDLGTVQADTNGLLQFNDTNAPAFPARFYYTTPQ
jgi:hypothetical protein